jgi:SpoVK/Ycf46/Vps4 family AAA+-type ATPase
MNKISKKYKFKSSTDINNYNKFLLGLDNKGKNNISSTDVLTNYINEINKTFENTNGFNIVNNNEITEIEDPNQYTEIQKSDKNNKQSLLSKRKGTALSKGTTLSKGTALSKDEETICNILNSFKIPISNSKLKPFPERPDIEPIIKRHITINAEINNISDLLNLIECYPDDNEVKYNINMKILHKIKEPLTDLNNMIGMKNLKENIVDQILFYIQNLHKQPDNKTKSNSDFMHTVIYGPPGTGKTEIAKIMGQIFAKIGVLKKGTFKKVTRSDLIAGYLGQTAIKTTDVIKECLGGVLFIDEAYSLGSPEKRDTFAKECIDTLCEALSDHKDNLMVIVAGYEHELNECFFNSNQGLNSRFTWRFKTDEYSAEDLYQIFLKKVKQAGWDLLENTDINTSISVKWFEKHKSSFVFYGRDIETLFAKIKIAHSRRVFCLDEEFKKKITIKDMDKGLEIFLKNDNNDNTKKNNMRKVISSMYI